jgi:intein/homing endonuclease
MVVLHHSRKYNLNESFFSSWSSEMAYVFGFWCADGDMQHERSYRVSFSSNDFEHLEKIKNCVGSNAKIYRFHRYGVPQNCFYLTLHSKKLHLDLKKLGGKRNNSTSLVFPQHIPEIYLADFIRGYFDGDGSVHSITYKASKNGKIYTETRSNFTCGSKEFLEDLRDTLSTRLGSANKIVGQYGPHQFKLGYNQKDTYKLLRYLYYPGHKTSLFRKAKYLHKSDE